MKILKIAWILKYKFYKKLGLFFRILFYIYFDWIAASQIVKLKGCNS